MNPKLLWLAAVVLLQSMESRSQPAEVRLDLLVDGVVATHMTDRKIPGLSVAIVHDKQLVLSKGYGKASLEFDLAATPQTVYPISSVSKMFAGLTAIRLASKGEIDLDAPIAEYLPDVPGDKAGVTIRHLLQHTHGLEDFYGSGAYQEETGLTVDESTTDELVEWSLSRPLISPPGQAWSYSLAGYVIFGHLLETIGAATYEERVREEVLTPLGIEAFFGGSESVVARRNPLLYELVDGEVAGHVVDFPEKTWPAGGLNLSVLEMARLFYAFDDEWFIGPAGKEQLWSNVTLEDGQKSNYGLGWFSYLTSQDRWVVGHEGGGASWVIYYPDHDLAVIALSNMSGARADSLPYEIARAAFDAGLFPRQ